jgi:heme exporter protein D
MQTLQLEQIKTQLARAWEWLRQRAERAPKEVWVAAGLCLLVVLLVGLHTVFSQKSAILRVRVQHSFRTAQITVSVDDEKAYSGKLTGVMHKKLGLLPDGIQGRWSQGIPVTAGRHRIGIRVVGDDGSDHADNTAANFVSGGERELVVASRQADLSATWAGSGNSVSASAAPTPSESQPSWLSRYASTLFLTVAGSIVSALSGYAIRELPARLRNRTAEAKASSSHAAAAGR